MKIKIITKNLGLIGFIALTLSFIGVKAYAFSGLLDDYSGRNFSHVGKGAQDDFTTYGTIKVQHWTDFFKGSNAGMEIYVEKKMWWGGYAYPSTSQFVYGTGYKLLRFKLPEKGTYRMHFKSTSSKSLVTFHGKVWDYE